MHEVSRVAELVEAARDRAADRPVSLVRVRYATTIPEDVLRQAFEMLTVGGPLEHAILAAEPFDIRLRCACGFDGALGHDDVVGPSQGICPACGELSALPPTAEIELLEVIATA
jgi:Zn finger protein HypA/HybF involved in hydrogenase expression